MTRTNRLFQLMQALRNHRPPVTAALLAQETGVSERTLYRDIEALRGLGAVIDSTAGYGYALTEDPALPPMMFNDEEIEALVLGLRDVQAIADPALAKAAGNALTKLQARLPSAQAHRLKHAVLAVNRIVPPPKPSIDVAALRRATWDEYSVAFGYEDGQGAQTERTIDPLGIVFLQDRHCVIGWCHLRGDSRVFRLDRMRDLVVTGDSFRPRRIPMLQDALAKIRADVAEKVKRHGPVA
ncbi:YafY family transcriptional regulator [Loktanella sp. F6476L]|uniref:helix-turn-helix transcriptional regulator n=1 Tax=Loktanella sp. F6476L TaxID=2926405 RepID=UPI001FF5EFFD|nr:YafY family protein [Loktanella sp. F6476L]MCK0121871.1 YafY family transcriptional regulator [Loktanella sp. F6476L]